MGPQTPPDSSASITSNLPTPVPSGSLFKSNMDTKVNGITSREDVKHEPQTSSTIDKDSAPKSNGGSQETNPTQPDDLEEDNDNIMPNAPESEPKEDLEVSSTTTRERESVATTPPAPPTAAPINGSGSPRKVIRPEKVQDENGITELTNDDIDQMPEGELRTKLRGAVGMTRQFQDSVQRYEDALSHIELQNLLLTIQSHESQQRFEVETNLVQREVDRLRYDKNGGLNQSAEIYRRRLRKAKQRLKDVERSNLEKNAEIEKLRKRIRDNRQYHESMEAAAVAHQQQQYQHQQAMAAAYHQHWQQAQAYQQYQQYHDPYHQYYQHLHQMPHQASVGMGGGGGGGGGGGTPTANTSTTASSSSAAAATGATTAGTSSNGAPNSTSATTTSPPQTHAATATQASPKPSTYTPQAPSTPQAEQPSSPASGHATPGSNDKLNTLGMLASQVLSEQQTATTPSPKKEQQRRSSRHARQDSGESERELMSPVDFENSPEKRRRESSASTISVPSDGNHTEDEDKNASPKAKKTSRKVKAKGKGK